MDSGIVRTALTNTLPWNVIAANRARSGRTRECRSGTQTGKNTSRIQASIADDFKRLL